MGSQTGRYATVGGPTETWPWPGHDDRSEQLGCWREDVFDRRGSYESAMATQATRTAKEGGPRAPGRALPLNSRRLTAAQDC